MFSLGRELRFDCAHITEPTGVEDDRDFLDAETSAKMLEVLLELGMGAATDFVSGKNR